MLCNIWAESIMNNGKCETNNCYHHEYSVYIIFYEWPIPQDSYNFFSLLKQPRVQTQIHRCVRKKKKKFIVALALFLAAGLRNDRHWPTLLHNNIIHTIKHNVSSVAASDQGPQGKENIG